MKVIICISQSSIHKAAINERCKRSTSHLWIVGNASIREISIEDLDFSAYDPSTDVLVIIIPINSQKREINLNIIPNVDSLEIIDIPNVDHIILSGCHKLKEIRLLNLLALASVIFLDVNVNDIADISIGNYMIKYYE